MSVVLTNVAKYDAVFCRSHFHIGLDVCKIMRGQSERGGLLHQLQISCELDKSRLETHSRYDADTDTFDRTYLV